MTCDTVFNAIYSLLEKSVSNLIAKRGSTRRALRVYFRNEPTIGSPLRVRERFLAFRSTFLSSRATTPDDPPPPSSSLQRGDGGVVPRALAFAAGGLTAS